MRNKNAIEATLLALLCFLVCHCGGWDSEKILQVRFSPALSLKKEGSAWWTFWIFFTFFGSESEAPGRGRGLVFVLKTPGVGGGPRGLEGACREFGGGEAKYIFWGAKIPTEVWVW